MTHFVPVWCTRGTDSSLEFVTMMIRLGRSLKWVGVFLAVAMAAGCNNAVDATVASAPVTNAPVTDAPVGNAPETNVPPSGGLAPTACIAKPDHRVLYLGNSQLAVWDMPTLINSMANSALAPCPKIAGELVNGGNLRELWLAGNAAAEIRSGKYDTVVLAESIDIVYPGAEGYPSAFETYATAFIELARSVGVEPVLYATPSVQNQNMVQDFTAMATPQKALARALNVKLASGGLAWLRAWREQPDLVLHASDAAHPGFVGSYLSSLVIFAAINDASPQGLTNAPVTDCNFGPCVPISTELAAQLQRIAWEEYLSSRQP